MSLNKYMHPRNRYKNAKPSFLHLALKYPEFRAVTTQDEGGKVLLDFKNADALRALTKCLMKDDFDLDVELPMDRLVPTLPLRLNYIHWLEDIVGTESGKWGIDIGTGASCVYPLLASKMNQWNFLATEADPENFYHAEKNVSSNGLTRYIHVKQTSDESIFTTLLETFKANDKFDFCMCNPPFFADHMEAQGLNTSRSVDRPEAGSVSTASPQECITTGGEVAFIRQMIEESTVLREKIRVYSSMVGKKSSLAQLKEELRHQKVGKFSTTEFCQGKTMRWGIAWTFDDSVNFPKSQFESRKTKPPLQYIIPLGSGGVEYKVHNLAVFLRGVLESIKVHCYQGKQAKAYTSITLTAPENTWCHQRRLRRQQQKKLSESGATTETAGQQETAEKSAIDVTKKAEENDPSHLMKAQDAIENERQSSSCFQTESKVIDMASGDKEIITSSASNDTNIMKETEGSDVKANTSKTATKRQLDGMPVGEESSAKKFKTERCENNNTCVNSQSSTIYGSAQCLMNSVTSSGESGIEGVDSGVEIDKPDKNGQDFYKNDQTKSEVSASSSSAEQYQADELASLPSTSVVDESPKEYILKCVMRLKRAGEAINLELDWLDGKSRELMHQVFTFLKNKLAQSVKT